MTCRNCWVVYSRSCTPKTGRSDMADNDYDKVVYYYNGPRSKRRSPDDKRSQPPLCKAYSIFLDSNIRTFRKTDIQIRINPRLSQHFRHLLGSHNAVKVNSYPIFLIEPFKGKISFKSVLTGPSPTEDKLSVYIFQTFELHVNT